MTNKKMKQLKKQFKTQEQKEKELYPISKEMFDALMIVREEGEVNMFDVQGVIRELAKQGTAGSTAMIEFFMVDNSIEMYFSFICDGSYSHPENLTNYNLIREDKWVVEFNEEIDAQQQKGEPRTYLMDELHTI